MLQRSEPVRFSVELHDDPTRGWVLGFVGTSGERMEMSVGQGDARREPAIASMPVIWPADSYLESAWYGGSAMALAECECPSDCPRDHPNE